MFVLIGWTCLAGKLFGLHAGDGRLLWTSSAALGPPEAGSRKYLLEWRRFHDLTHAPELAVLVAGPGASVLHVVNAHTGEQLQEQELPYGVDKVGGSEGSHTAVQVWVTAAGAGLG